MAKKKGFNLSDPATLIGFIIGLLVTYVFGIFTGLIAIVVAVIVFAVIDQKKIGNVVHNYYLNILV